MNSKLFNLTPRYRAIGYLGTLWFFVLMVSPAMAEDKAPSDKEVLQQLKQEISSLKESYERRLEKLEARLAATEKSLREANSQARNAQVTTDPYAVAGSAGNSGQSRNAFNPAISLVLDGRYVDYTSRPDTGYLPGFRYNPEYGLDAEGFHLGESELTLSANVDDKFYGQATISFGNEDGETVTEVEEAFVQTTALSHGLTAKVGRYFSAFGYLNEQHPHAWDFADQPLVYSALLGGSLKNEGVQVTWLLPTDFYLESGIELGNGQPFPAGGNHNGFSAQTAFLTTGGDIGLSHSWQAGLSWWHGKSDAAAVNESDWEFAGNSYLTAFDLVYKWAPLGNTKEKNFKLQFEYIRNRDNGQLLAGTASPNYSATRDGWYAQAVWQFRPLWRTGIRYDRVKADAAEASGMPQPWLTETGLLSTGESFYRTSAMIEWIPSEFSRLRLQYNAPLSGGGSDIDPATIEDAKWTFQYTVSMGSHGAHQY